MQQRSDASSSKHELLSAIVVATLLVTPSAAQVKRLRPPDVRFVPTPQNVVEAMLDLAQVTPADIVYVMVYLWTIR